MQPEPTAGSGTLKMKADAADILRQTPTFDDPLGGDRYSVPSLDTSFSGASVSLGGYAEPAAQDNVAMFEAYREGVLFESRRLGPWPNIDTEIDGVVTRAIPQSQIETRPLPMATPTAAYGDESFGQYLNQRLGQWGDGINDRLDAFGSAPDTPDALRFVAAMVKNPANWVIGAVQGTGGGGIYAFDSRYRSQVNDSVLSFLADDPIGTTRAAATRYWDEHSGLELARDGFNLVASGMVGSPVAKLPGMTLRETVSLTGAAGEKLLGWSQKLSDYSFEWPDAPTGFGRYQMGGVAVPSIRNLRAEVTELLPEGFDLVRVGRGGAAILRFGDDTFYSVPKSQYSLIPELRSMDTMGGVFTRRVQSIADGFDPSLHLSDAQNLRLGLTPDGWLKNKFMSSYKGSYVDKEFGRELPYLPGGSDYAKMSVGPDVIRVGGGGNGLSYEITQLTPSLNAIYSDLPPSAVPVIPRGPGVEG